MFYIPLFNKVVDSSLWDESDLVVKVFLTMIAKQDADHVVRASAYNISKWAKKSEAEILEAISILSAPDTKRLEPQPFDGRRVKKVDGGYLILNGAFYQELMEKCNNRVYQRKWQREKRAKEKAATNGTPAPGEDGYVDAVSEGGEEAGNAHLAKLEKLKADAFDEGRHTSLQPFVEHLERESVKFGDALAASWAPVPTSPPSPGPIIGKKVGLVVNDRTGV